MNNKINYYNTKRIDKTGAIYRIIIGMRSNGKTTAVLKKIIDNYLKNGSQGAYVRRWDEDIRPKYCATMFDGILSFFDLKKATNGKFNTIIFKSNKFYFANNQTDDGKIIYDEKPFCFTFALTQSEHYKGNSYPNITTILFDEFMTNGYYLPNEFVYFKNVISTISRLRENIIIYLCGNTVSKDCLYFHEFMIDKEFKKMKQGDILFFSFTNSEITIAIEWSNSDLKPGKVANIYTDFSNGAGDMINNGKWELLSYPHLSENFNINNIKFIFFIDYNFEITQCEIIQEKNKLFIYCHKKTTDIQSPEKDLIYCDKIIEKNNYSSNLFKPRNRIESLILKLFNDNKVFYQNNEIGDNVNSFLNQCK